MTSSLNAPRGKEYGMLMKGPLVLATLDGRKTQTRRLDGLHEINKHPGEAEFVRFQDGYKDGRVRAVFDVGGEIVGIPCPYGYVGDRIWIRETWAVDDYGYSMPPLIHSATIQYKADNGEICFECPQSFYDREAELDDAGRNPDRWRSPVTMPRLFSRLSLEVTAVVHQRIQAISEADAMASGAKPVLVPPDGGSAPHVEGYRDRWEATYPGSWERNDWVWAYTFRLLSGGSSA